MLLCPAVERRKLRASVIDLSVLRILSSVRREKKMLFFFFSWVLDKIGILKKFATKEEGLNI